MIQSLPEVVLKIYDNCKDLIYEIPKQDIVHTPKNVKKYRRGTCWDQSLYVAYEALRYLNPEDVKLTFTWHSVQKKTATHSVTRVRVGNKWYWIETAWEEYRGIHTDDDYLELDSALIANTDVQYQELFKFTKDIPGDVYVDICMGKETADRLITDFAHKQSLKIDMKNTDIVYRALWIEDPNGIPSCSGFVSASIGDEQGELSVKAFTRGNASGLMDRVILVAKTFGYKQLVWRTNKENFPADRLAESLGFKRDRSTEEYGVYRLTL